MNELEEKKEVKGRLKNNRATVTGIVIQEFQPDHKNHGEMFYRGVIASERNSGVYDAMQVVVSERVDGIEDVKPDEIIKVNGSFRSCNKEERKLDLFLFADSIEAIDQEDWFDNQIYLCGHICKKPVYRMTPLGRQITDVLLAVNRGYNRSDYIPCIVWGRNAEYAKNLDVGTMIKLTGRIQSRQYTKKIGEEHVIKTAYEVSAKYMEVVEDDSRGNRIE
ncbi:MAG: single-stranded DNA-binding protein [Clostridiales bacterium]|nr:single-stranded DNA-binding protein [Clostridiales bacterium]